MKNLRNGSRGTPLRTFVRIEPQQLLQRLVFGNPGIPTVGCCDGRIEYRVRISEPLRPGIVKVRQRAALSCFAAAASRATGRFG